MALSTDKKLYVALGVLVLLGGALFIQRRQAVEESATYTLEGRTADLPKIEIGDEQTKKINRLVIKQPAGDAGPASEIELKKDGETWKITKPIEAAANDANVTSLLDNLKSLKVGERIDPTKDQYAKYDVSDDKAVHAAFYAGDKKAHEFYFGQNGSRGQMTRIADKDGVYAIKGYSSYLYTRDLKGWRELTLFKFEEDKVERVEIENEQGSFVFEKSKKDDAKKDDVKKDDAKKDDAKWTSKHKPAKGPAAAAIKNFDPAKVDDMIRAYKALNATDFTRDKKDADVGLEKPKAVVSFTLADGAKRVLRVGDTAEGSNRWVKRPEDTEIFQVSSWAADWATAELKKFQKSEEKKDEAAADMAPMDPHMGAANLGGH